MANRFFKIYNKFGSYFVLIVVFLFFAVTQDFFLAPTNLLNILRQVSIYGIIITGITFIMLSGGADLSVGGQIACLGLFLAAMVTQWNVPTIPAILITLLVGTGIGALIGLLAAILDVTPLIITLCFMLVLNGIALVVTNGYPIYDMPELILQIGQGTVGPIPICVILLVIICFIGWFLLSKTYFGRSTYALGGNKEAARLAGINITKIRILVYALGGFFTAIGGLVLLGRTNSATATAGSSYPFDCMTAACLGGITFGGGNGTMINSFVGVLVIGILANGLTLMGLNTNVQQIIKGLLLFFAISVGALQKKYQTFD